MATVLFTYKVHYHHETGGKINGDKYIDYVQSTSGPTTSNLGSTLTTVLSNNSKARPGTLVIDSVQEVGHGDVAAA